MNTSDNIVMTITPEIIKNRVIQFAGELCERGEFHKFASENDLTFIKTKFDEFLRDDIINQIVQAIQEDYEGEDSEGDQEIQEDGGSGIISIFFNYQRVQVKNRVIQLARELCENGEFKKFAYENYLSFTASKLDEFLKDYTIEQMVDKIQKEFQVYECDKLLGDYIITVFFEYRRTQIKNRLIQTLATLCHMGVFQNIAFEHNLNFNKSKLDEFIRNNLNEMVKAIEMEKDSLYEEEDGKLLKEYLMSVCVENTMM